MIASILAPNPRVRLVSGFQELATTPFAAGVNAFCWPRVLPGDFREIVDRITATASDDIVTLEEANLRAFSLSPVGQTAVEVLLADLRLLRERDLAPVLNCIYGYPRDEEAGPVATDVFSFHADSAPVPAETWLCTYHGAPSEGLLNEQALRRIDVPETRAALLDLYGGADDDDFSVWLHEHCYDLHYLPTPHAEPYSFGQFNLWRVAVEHPNAPVPPCIHRAPATIRGEPRLLLIS